MLHIYIYIYIYIYVTLYIYLLFRMSLKKLPFSAYKDGDLNK